jgi:V-type H+-transporting ATPase subunit H
MSLDPPAYILSLQNNIRARPISWDGAVRAKTITDEDLKKIKAIDKVRKEQRRQVIEGDVKTYTQLLLGGDDVKSIFESAVKRSDILQYMLVLAGDLVDGTASHHRSTGRLLTYGRYPCLDRLPYQASRAI